MNQLSVSTATSHIDLGTSFTNTLKLSPSGNIVWTGSALTIDDWVNGLTHVFVGNTPYSASSTTMGLSASQLQRITFSGFSPGATLIAGGELVPQDVGGAIPALLKGDINHDNHVNAADVTAMLSAITDLNKFASTNNLFASDVAFLGDVDSDGSFTNADIQSLLTLLVNGGGSVAAVPEPTSIWLFAVALPGLVLAVARRPGR